MTTYINLQIFADFDMKNCCVQQMMKWSICWWRENWNARFLKMNEEVVLNDVYMIWSIRQEGCILGCNMRVCLHFSSLKLFMFTHVSMLRKSLAHLKTTDYKKKHSQTIWRRRILFIKQNFVSSLVINTLHCMDGKHGTF